MLPRDDHRRRPANRQTRGGAENRPDVARKKLTENRANDQACERDTVNEHDAGQQPALVHRNVHLFANPQR